MILSADCMRHNVFLSGCGGVEHIISFPLPRFVSYGVPIGGVWGAYISSPTYSAHTNITVKNEISEVAMSHREEAIDVENRL